MTKPDDNNEDDVMVDLVCFLCGRTSTNMKFAGGKLYCNVCQERAMRSPIVLPRMPTPPQPLPTVERESWTTTLKHWMRELGSLALMVIVVLLVIGFIVLVWILNHIRIEI